MAAVKALADLTRESVPEQVNIAYRETRLTFGKDYIIPKPFDPKLISSIPPGVTKAAMESGVTQRPITDWSTYREELLDCLGNDNKIVRLLTNRAKADPKRIAFAEEEHLDVLKAAQIILEEGIGISILLGNRATIEKLKSELGFFDEVEIIDPKDASNAKLKSYAIALWKISRRREISLFDAEKLIQQQNYFASMMIHTGDVDTMLIGYSKSYPSSIKPTLQIVERQIGVGRIATTNMMMSKRGPIFLSDTAINPDPSAIELVDITLLTAHTARLFGIEPIIAMISFSNFGFSSDSRAVKVREAVTILHREHPEIIVDGEFQADFALNPDLMQSKFPFSKLAGKKVNTLIFPNLDSANITYKLLKELDQMISIGPIMMGMSSSAHIVQLGASVEEMVNMATVAVVDAKEKGKPN